MTAARFGMAAVALTSRCRALPRRRFDTPGRALGSIPLIRSCPG
jgi:hypothetical protein